ncbi:H/ACA ribonucleoprotein complex non-core subunit NAF1 [Trichinella spiralis]|uniref:H/ACA ribonucleoprotein complex non-core subunit NAF1 n=1 Tax=Trichinella spiralis TaxID=6334 RepID=UPI0001EFB8F7|nr:H/ACA ribonucleoprotein complex non-core subunit NAF1 [Trichinella spiralis]
MVFKMFSFTMNNTSTKTFCNTDSHLNAKTLSAESSPNSVDDGQIECDVMQVVQQLVEHVDDEFTSNGGYDLNKFNIWKFCSRKFSDSTASNSSADDDSSISDSSLAEFSDSSDISVDSESNLLWRLKFTANCLLNENVPPLAENTIVFNDSRKSVGEVYMFGLVKRPMYVIRYNDKSEIEELELKEKMKLYYADDPDFTNKLIPLSLITKGSDASWMHNHEVPEDERDFSDDETERKWKSSMRKNCANNRQCDKSEPPMMNAEEVSNCARKRQRNNQRRNDNNFKFAEGVQQAVPMPVDNFAQNGQRSQLYHPRNYPNPTRYGRVRYPARMDHNPMIAGGSRFHAAPQHRFPNMATMPALRCSRFGSTRMPGNVPFQQNGNHGFAGFGTRNPHSNPFRNPRARFHR